MSDKKSQTEKTWVFAKVPKSVIELQPQIGATIFAVYCALTWYADSTSGECWPSMRTIATRTGMSKKTISESLKTLEARGIIRIERRRKASGASTSNYYYIYPSGEGVERTPPPPVGSVGRTQGRVLRELLNKIQRLTRIMERSLGKQ